MNKRNYPNSYNVYEAAGNFYNSRGEDANAISNYKKALAIKKDIETKKKFEKLLPK